MKDTRAKKRKETPAPMLRAQDWYPITDIKNNIAHLRDGSLLAVLRLYPINLELLSKDEKKSKVTAITEWLNSESGNVQIFCIGRPIDLAHFQDWQQDTLEKTEDYIKKQILKKLIMYTASLAASGNVTERRFYLILKRNSAKNTENDLIAKLEEIRQKLMAAQLQSEICTEKELYSLYLLFSYPGNIDESYEYANIGTILEA